MGQTIVRLSSVYCKPLRRASCFFQNGRSSEIARNGAFGVQNLLNRIVQYYSHATKNTVTPSAIGRISRVSHSGVAKLGRTGARAQATTGRAH